MSVQTLEHPGETTTARRTIRVLSIDGGGIRGIIPARFIEELEKVSGKPVAELFDVVAGTSTGGILALGLALPNGDGRPRFTGSDLLRLYETEGARIFHRSPWHRLAALNNLADEKYESRGIEDVLHEYFGDAMLSDALIKVLVTAYDIERREPYFFKSYRASEDPDRQATVVAAARATSAAPTYFEPTSVPTNSGSDYRALIDGGVFANNPGMCAYVEARDLFPDATDFLVVSLGTGQLTRRIPIDEAKGWGLAMWAQPLLGVVFDGVSDSVDYQLRMLCKTDDDVQRYHRLQVSLTEGSDDMDEVSNTNLRALRLLAERYISDSGETFQTIARQLCQPSAVAR